MTTSSKETPGNGEDSVRFSSIFRMFEAKPKVESTVMTDEPISRPVNRLRAKKPSASIGTMTDPCADEFAEAATDADSQTCSSSTFEQQAGHETEQPTGNEMTDGGRSSSLSRPGGSNISSPTDGGYGLLLDSKEETSECRFGFKGTSGKAVGDSEVLSDSGFGSKDNQRMNSSGETLESKCELRGKPGNIRSTDGETESKSDEEKRSDSHDDATECRQTEKNLLTSGTDHGTEPRDGSKAKHGRIGDGNKNVSEGNNDDSQDEEESVTVTKYGAGGSDGAFVDGKRLEHKGDSHSEGVYDRVISVHERNETSAGEGHQTPEFGTGSIDTLNSDDLMHIQNKGTHFATITQNPRNSGNEFSAITQSTDSTSNQQNKREDSKLSTLEPAEDSTAIDPISRATIMMRQCVAKQDQDSQVEPLTGKGNNGDDDNECSSVLKSNSSTRKSASTNTDKTTNAKNSSSEFECQTEEGDIGLPTHSKSVACDQSTDIEDSFASCFWFFDEVDRDKSEELLTQMIELPGSYLVRKSVRGGDCSQYTLSVVYRKHIYHVLIRQRPDKMYAIGKMKDVEKVFGTIPELIGFYQNNFVELIGDSNKKTVPGKVQLKHCPPK